MLTTFVTYCCVAFYLVFVSNLSYSTEEDGLTKCMSQFGAVAFSKIVVDPDTEHSKGSHKPTKFPAIFCIKVVDQEAEWLQYFITKICHKKTVHVVIANSIQYILLNNQASSVIDSTFSDWSETYKNYWFRLAATSVQS